MSRYDRALLIAERELGRHLAEEEAAASVAIFDRIIADYSRAASQGEAGRLLITGRDRDGTRRQEAQSALTEMEKVVEFLRQQVRGLSLASGTPFDEIEAEIRAALSGMRWVCWSIHGFAASPELPLHIDFIRENFAPDLPTHHVRVYGGRHSEEWTTPKFVVGHFIEWWCKELELPVPRNGPQQPFTQVVRLVCEEGGIPAPSDHYFKKAIRDAREAITDKSRREIKNHRARRTLATVGVVR